MINPTVSVVMPVYNTERYLHRAIDSILKQTFTDFEFILVDDGSTDRSLQLIKMFARSDSRIRFISRENRGITHSLNELISESRGEFIARMDADDVSMPERLESQVAFLRKNSEYALVGTNVKIVDPNGRVLRVPNLPCTHDDLVDALLGRIGQMIYHPSVMMRASAIRRVGGYSADYPLAQDLKLFLDLSQEHKIGNLSDVLLEYREHFDKVGSTRRAEQFAAVDAIINHARSVRGMPALPPSEVPAAVSADDVYLKWAWWALNSKELGTARRYALASLTHRPMDRKRWKALLCALRGH